MCWSGPFNLWWCAETWTMDQRNAFVQHSPMGSTLGPVSLSWLRQDDPSGALGVCTPCTTGLPLLCWVEIKVQMGCSLRLLGQKLAAFYMNYFSLGYFQDSGVPESVRGSRQLPSVWTQEMKGIKKREKKQCPFVDLDRFSSITKWLNECCLLPEFWEFMLKQNLGREYGFISAASDMLSDRIMQEEWFLETQQKWTRQARAFRCLFIYLFFARL